MIEKIVNKYLEKYKLKLVNEKEYENIYKYRATRGELKRTIEDYNTVIIDLANTSTVKFLKDKLISKNIDVSNMSKEEMQQIFIDKFSKEFKKSQIRLDSNNKNSL